MHYKPRSSPLDSKFPLDNYLKYHEATDDATRSIHRDAFIKNAEQRVKELEKRDYTGQSDRQALDYVLLFIPNESILGFIQQEKPSLIDDAIHRRVVLCSPLTLYAFLAVVRQATDSFHMEQNANEVLGILNAFGKSWRHYSKHIDTMGKSFEKIGDVLVAQGKGEEALADLVRARAAGAGFDAAAKAAMNQRGDEWNFANHSANTVRMR